MLATLRQRRFYGLIAVTLVVATVCVLAGTWQVARFREKHAANHALRSNNNDTVSDISAALGPASAPTATGSTDQFRHITATGTYLVRDETMVRGQTVGGDVGYLVLTPLQTRSGVLLIVRGFVAQTAIARDTPAVPSAPSGQVSVTARIEPAETRTDRYGALPQNQVESINPIDQSRRLGQPVWNAYAELLDGQPGTSGLTVIPDPDLSNPAGGADEPQHAAYVVQWYLFAGLALALPFVLAAAERRREAEETEARSEAEPTEQLDPAQPVGPRDGADAEPALPGTPQPVPAPQPAPAVTPQQRQRLTRRQRKADLDDRLAGRH